MNYLDIGVFYNQLDSFIDLVEKYDVKFDASSLYGFKAANYNLQNIKYHFEDLNFYIDSSISNSIPDFDFIEIKVTHGIEISDAIDEAKDSIIDFLLNIDIDATHIESNNKYYSCWHLDKHIEKEEDGEPKFTHPIYHFQFGGNYIEGKDTGQLCIISNPRLPHPPMDLFLTFNFILNNFYSKRDFNFVNELLEDEEYKNVIQISQERMWKDYFNAFTNNITNKNYTLNRVFPMFIN
jgi:hypothetical protein